MSDNVQVAQPPSGIEGWQRSLPWWDAYFGAVAAGTILAAPDSAVFLLAIAAWYVFFGRRVMRGEHNITAGVVYLAVAGALLVPALALDNGASFILFALSPQAQMALAFRRGTVAAVILNLLPTAVLYVRTGSVLPALPIGILAIILTTMIGFSIDKLIQQSLELAASRAEVARLSQEAERQRLAADLHDTIAQGLSSVVMLIQAAEAALSRDADETRRHLELAERTARENLKEVRTVLDALMPSQQDLPETLRRLSDRFIQETGVAAAVRVDGPPRALPVSLEVVLLRAAQESLSNVRQHSGASEVTMVLSYESDSVSLEVTDNGCGFELSQPFDGYGLQAMRSRVTQVGGDFAVEPSEKGTAIRVAVPA